MRLTASCVACRAASPLLFLARDRNRRMTAAEFPYHRCPSCGLVFLWPVPTDLDRYYGSDYYSVPGGPEALARAADLERYKIEIVRRFVSSGPLLEIGPAYGSFLHLAREAGFAAEGIEMNEECCEFIRTVVGVPVIQSADPATAVRHAGPYRVVALWHVLEHLPDPFRVLEAVSARLEPGGILVIAAPNPEALQLRLLGRFWPHLDAPRHLALLPRQLLAARLHPLGVEETWATTDDPGARQWNDYGWRYSLVRQAGAGRVGRRLHRLAALAGSLLAPWERREGRGSTYTLVFRREGDV